MKTRTQIGSGILLFQRVLTALCLMVLLAACMTGCSNHHQETNFDIPEGLANQTLKEFARQAEVEILFDLQIVDKVRTKAVSGSYHPHDALGRMIEETNLAYHIEPQTGAFAVALKDLPPAKPTGR